MTTTTLDGQRIGAVGIAWATYECTRRGWNALVTTRHRAGPDLWVDVGDGRAVPVQVKAITVAGGRMKPINLGTTSRDGGETVLVIVLVAKSASPVTVGASFVMRYADALAAARIYQGTRWLQPNDYSRPEYLDAWPMLAAPIHPPVAPPP